MHLERCIHPWSKFAATSRRFLKSGPRARIDRESILAEKWIQQAWRPPVRQSAISRSHERENMYTYTGSRGSPPPRTASASRLATVSTILARTGGGKFGNKICSRQLDRARCQKRLLIPYLASSISCQVCRSASGSAVDGCFSISGGIALVAYRRLAKKRERKRFKKKTGHTYTPRDRSMPEN